jgi:glutamate racemase
LETVYRFTLQGVQYLFDQGCSLVILACNSASAKALRNIQQKYLPVHAPDKRVLGVIRPTTESIGQHTHTGVVGILGTSATVESRSYAIEIKKFFPEMVIIQQACPMWVPLVENHELTGAGTDYFVKKYVEALLQQNDHLDAAILACTHYPMLLPIIRKHFDKSVNIISQGPIVADRLRWYLHKHPEIEAKCSKNGVVQFLTTESQLNFSEKGSLFYESEIKAVQIRLD